MHCHEARQKIDGFDRTQFDSNRDKELLEHLQSCSKCAEMAESTMLLNRDLETNSAGDTEGGLSFPNLKSRVEETVDARQNQLNKDSNIMSKLINSVTKRPRLGLSLGVVIVLLAFVTLVPFKFERTIGYEVAIAGVDRDLALDSDKVQTLFIKLGLDDAKFDVSNCEATCNMKITHLKSEDDAKIIVAAFDELGNCQFEEVKRIQGEHSTPLLWYRSGGNVSLVSESDDSTNGPLEVTMDATLFLDKVDGKTKIYVSDVVGKLSSESTGEFNIWVSKGDADGEEIIVVDPTDSHSVIYIDSLAMSGNNSDEQVWGIGEDDLKTTVRFLTNESGESKFIVKTPDGNINIFDYDEDNVVEKLNKLGVDVQ
ncbi:MAG: hypothetical protein GY865_15610, partial [candidate division Zixibacteria bacterium]|nr:hypothetical protein [candidate division Zixibacteria bacterium]